MRNTNLIQKKNIKSSLLIIIFLLFNGISIQQVCQNHQLITSKPRLGSISDYLYLDSIQYEEYYFFAENECYILIEIEGTGFTTFILDGIEYTLSNGLNKISKLFSGGLSGFPENTHKIEIEPSQIAYFKSITVEPLLIDEGEIKTNLTSYNDIQFMAGGLISILLQLNFSYNWLYLEVDNEKIKDLNFPMDTDFYEINSQLFSYYLDGGPYIRFDIDVAPGSHNLSLQGDGALKYKIVVNFDWDGDYLSDVEEFQYELLYNVNPTVPDIWGFFDKSPAVSSSYKYDEDVNLPGHFNFYLPDVAFDKWLYIDVYNGEFSEFNVDGDYLRMEDEILSAEPPNVDSYWYGIIEPGWHYITYEYKANLASNITFRIYTEKVEVLNTPEFIDSDGDGIKDVIELSNGLDIFNQDTDDDGIPDSYDASPLSSLTLNREKIHQFIIPVSSDKNTLINMQIKRPVHDYSTGSTQRLWMNTLNVSIYPALRLFEAHRYRDNLGNYWCRQIETHTLVNPNAYNGQYYGDGHPNPGDDDYMLYVAKSAKESFEFDINFPKDHAANDDGFLDIRFDFIWLVTYYDPETMETNVLQYYDFEDDIIVQAMVKREISDVNYILGTPDSLIENQILWALVQNPNLGSPSEFNLNNDIIGKDEVDYFSLPESCIEDLEAYNAQYSTPPEENQVLYVAGLTDNYDILNKFYIKNDNSLPFEVKNQGDYSMLYTYYSINNVYEDEEYTLGDPELEGEEKILFITSKTQFTQDSTTVIKLANVFEMPIHIEVEQNLDNKVLKITNAFGNEIPLAQIPYSTEGALYDKINIHYETYVEKNEASGSIPKLNFNEETDDYKQLYDNRPHEVEQGALFFNKYFESSSFRFDNLITKYINNIVKVRNILKYFDLNNPDLLAGYKNSKFDIYRNKNDEINEILGEDQFSEYFSYNKISAEVKLKAIKKINRLLADLAELNMELLKAIPEDDPIYENFILKATEISTSIENTYKIRISITSSILKTGQSNPLFKLEKTTKIRLKKAFGAISIAFNCFNLIFNTLEAFNIITHSEEYEGRTLEYAFEVAGALSQVFLDALSLADDIISLADDILPKTIPATTTATTQGVQKTTSTLSKASKFLGKAIIVVSIMVYAFQLGSLIAQHQSGEISDYEFTFQIVKLAVDFAISVGVGLALGAAFSSTGIGIGIGIAISIASLISGWLTDLLNDPDWDILIEDDPDVSPTRFYLPMDLIRQHGSLRKGDQIHFRLVGENTGNTKIWFKSKFRLNGGSYTSWKGRWGDSSLPGVYKPDQQAILDFYYNIPAATPDIKFQLNYKLDALITEYWFFFPVDHRVEGADEETDWQSIGLWALDENIKKFHQHTVPLKSIGIGQVQQLLEDFQDARDNFQYKTAYDTGVQAIQLAEQIAGLTRSYYNILEGRVIDLPDEDYDYDLLHANNEIEFMNLIDRFYDDDPLFRALHPILIYWLNLIIIQIPIPVPPKLGNTIAYTESGGYIKIPKNWLSSKNDILQYARDAQTMINNLPIKTNIRIPFESSLQEIDGQTGTLNVDFKFDLFGSDNPNVDIEIIGPDDFTISQSMFSQHLSDPISFQISRVDTSVLAGVHNFQFLVKLNNEIIYDRAIPFRMNTYRNLQFEPLIITDPIEPGEVVNLLNVVNYGNIPELVEIEAKDIPESFIYKDLNPDEWQGRIEQFSILPGETKQAFLVSPPRHFTTAPGTYNYNITAREMVVGILFSHIEGSIEVSPFYDSTFECFNPDISIYDYEIATYDFELTNHGNVPQTYTVTYSTVDFADPYLESDVFTLNPGQSVYFSIIMDPFDIGFQGFVVSVESTHYYHEIVASLEVKDDDIGEPWFENYMRTDDHNWLNINFDGLDELAGDDQGLSLIEIYVDNDPVPVLTHFPAPTDTHFDFNIVNEWIWDRGTHDIRVLIVDADDDRDGDNLFKEYYDSFEVTLDEMYNYVIWLLGEINNYIYDNHLVALYGAVTQKLVRVQDLLLEAYQLIETGQLHTGLVRNKLAEAKLEIAEAKAELKALKGQVGEPYVSEILSMMHNVRNKIIELMGLSMDTLLAHKLSLAEDDLYDLRDLVEENIAEIDRESLFNIISLAAEKLEDAIFDISLGKDTECSMIQAIHALDHAKAEVISLTKKGKISEQLKQILLTEILLLQAKIHQLIYEF